MRTNNNIPLKWKVIIGVTLTSTISVVLAIFVFAMIETQRLEQAVISESEIIAEIIGGNSVGSLSFSDTDSGLETLTVLKASPHIHDVVIYEENGEAFVWYSWSGDSKSSVMMGTVENLPSSLPKRVPLTRVNVLEENFTLVQNIQSEGVKIGSIYVLTDFGVRDAAVSNYIYVTAIIFIAVALLSFGLAM